MQFFSLLVSGLLCLCLTTPIFAQLQPLQPLSEQESLRQNHQLFTPLPARSAESALVEAAITEYQLLQLDEEALAQLKSAAPERLELELTYATESLSLKLERSYPFATNGKVRMASGRIFAQPEVGVHYRGSVVGFPDTHVALSVLNGEVQAMIARANGSNLVLGPLGQGRANRATYILYADNPVFQSQDLDCATEDSGVDYAPEQLAYPSAARDANVSNCVQVYFEVDYNIYQEKGANAAGYVAAAFNEVAVLYAAINVDLSISEIFVWDQPSPYGGTSSGTLLTQFQQHRPSFNGDVAQLLSYSASGGIAVLSGLCHPISAARMSFSSIGSSFQNVPTYSWTIMVIAHELGHLLGSQHSHACVWNGNGTAIDGCAGFTEGNCGNPGIPQNGGGIMSYCHLTSAGINFNVGFGTQPGAAIFNFISGAGCVSGNVCDGNPPPPPSTDECNDYQVILELTLDNFGPETSWVLENDAQEVFATGGPYDKKQAGTVMRDTFCLVEDCYVFRMVDAYEDGICCDFGSGGYLLLGPEGEILAEGNEFEDSELTDFCLPEGEPPVGSGDCVEINFLEYPVISYGITQDVGQSTVSDNGNQLEVRNNAWKAVAITYTITEETVLEFDFKSTIEGEIHGIGFDDNLGISPDLTFRLHGTQAWGNATYDNYADNAQWQHFVIPIGEFVAGTSAYLFFSADHDLGARNANSFFKNVEIYEGTPCGSGVNNSSIRENTTGAIERSSLSPNPADHQVTLRVVQAGNYEILDLSGRSVARGLVPNPGNHPIQVMTLAPGSYFLRYTSVEGMEETLRFTRSR
jgi:hypothetical protein